MGIHYYVDKNPVQPGSRRATLFRDEKRTFEQFVDFAQRASTVTRADVLAVIDNMVEWIVSNAVAGQEVDFGPLGQNRFGLSGTFRRRGGQSDELKPEDWRLTVGWQLPKALKERVNHSAHAEGLILHAKPGRNATIEGVTDALSKRQNAYKPGGLLVISGANLKFDQAREDEGVFLRRPRGKRVVRIQEYDVVYPQTLQVWMPDDLQGPQQLILRRRERRTAKRPKETIHDEVVMPIEA